MIIAAAQTIPKRGNISENLEDHYRLINLAADNSAQLILFPELSISGYERELAESLEFTPGDSRLDGLRNLAVKKNIIIVAGAPIRQESQLFIGAFIFHSNGSEIIYTKQYLHDGEEVYYSSGVNDCLQIKLDNEAFSVAICADITNPAHPLKAASLNSTIYLASIFYTPNGISTGYKDLQGYSMDLSMNVLMSNFGGPSYGMEAAGRSAFWNKEGDLSGSLERNGEGLLIVRKKQNIWKSEILMTASL
ncbi:carbon-nitrogen hydrolase family protein [Dyadobacter frigoris]|uniref:Carbon-nitrogen hydrolase family protein n=1 Tax=Dyadobacter frigoris TaxID=2576211 RepID=A0A4U6CYJ2_9BACT|nr:carbon-nitrogen hydrolase family protein [Dyadobacter frigoris]TKT88831.1 carbon-nitrogen hydrolase family protein [Dyadobacter frigoris]GLU56019.1 hydrolase [Dyadobacter frigoris]